MTRRITTVTFDFWGTLLRDGPGSDERYRQRRVQDMASILAHYGRPVHTTALERGYDKLVSYLGRVWREHRDISAEGHVREILRAVDARLLAQLPPEAVPSLVEAYARPAILVPPTVDPGALGALEALSERGYTLAVISNTMRTPGVALRKILERFGLLGYFKHATFSDEVHIRKPDPEIFLMTLRAVGAEAARSLHVGDDPVLDVEGARAAGMWVVQVGSLESRLSGPEADGAVPTLRELPDLLASLEH